MQIHRITFVLFVAVLLTAVFVFAQSGQQQKKPAPPQDSETQDALAKAQESRRSFPSVDYEESEPVDAVQKARRKEKQKRYDGFHQVIKNPDPNDAEIAVLFDGVRQLPALPLTESDVILVGVVQEAQAHLSDNKKNVYSEFTIRIKQVLKTLTSLPPDNLITVDREGGFVKYPNGQKVLYRMRGQQMPLVGKRYVFFLKYVNQDFRILTAFELGEQGVAPLDQLEQFQKFRGSDETTLLSTVRDSLAIPAPHQEQ